MFCNSTERLSMNVSSTICLRNVHVCFFNNKEFLSRSAWSVGAECAVPAPLTIVSEMRWENWVTDLNRPLASRRGGRDYITLTPEPVPY